MFGVNTKLILNEEVYPVCERYMKVSPVDFPVIYNLFEAIPASVPLPPEPSVHPPPTVPLSVLSKESDCMSVPVLGDVEDELDGEEDGEEEGELLGEADGLGVGDEDGLEDAEDVAEVSVST